MAATSQQAERAAESAAGVGPRIKNIRLARRMTIESVADASGLTKSFLSKVERGRSTPSVAALLRIAGALEIPLANLFETDATRHVQRAGAHPVVEFGGSDLVEYLLTPHAEQRVQVIMSQIAAGGGSGSELYQLPADVEFIYVIEGTLQLTFDDGDITLGAGDTMTFEPSTPRSFLAPVGGSGAKVLWVISPALPRSGRRGTMMPPPQ